MVNHLLHPYLLKQYNSRWYLIGGIDSDGFIVNFPLDRIEDIKVEPKVKYKPCNEDLSLRFKDIVGVTLTKGEEFQYVTLWADDKTFPYLETKHIVRFQENVTGKRKYSSANNTQIFKEGISSVSIRLTTSNSAVSSVLTSEGYWCLVQRRCKMRFLRKLTICIENI